MRPYVMGDNYYVKTFCGQANPPDETLMKVRLGYVFCLADIRLRTVHDIVAF